MEDIRRYYEEEPGRIRAQGFTRDELIEELRQEIRSCKQMWDNYRHYQDPNRGNLTAEEITEAETAYKDFKNDTAEIYEYDDIMDTLVRIRGTGNVMQHIIERGIKEGPLGDRSGHAQAQKPAHSNAGSMIIWALIIGAALFFIFR